MSTMAPNDLTLERLQLAFEAAGVSSTVVEVLPATPVLDRDAYLEVSYEFGRTVTIWPDLHEPTSLLRLRSVVLDRDESSRHEDLDLLYFAADANQLLDFFGALNVRSLLGVTVEYVIPWQDGLPDETIVLASKRLAAGAQSAREALASALGTDG